MADSQLLGILLIAMVAGIILFRLYTVLGRRTGNEREPQERLRRIGGAAPATSDTIAAVTDRTGVTQPAQSGEPTARGLLDIKLADRSFEKDHFLDGARQAYQMIVTAFAARDRATLHPLLSDEVFSAFDSVMRGREERNETVSYSFEGFRNVRIAHAEMKGQIAEITVEFSAQFISATTNASGSVVEGDPKAVRDVVDVWSFSRNVRAGDPNWTLVATAGGD
jgi:predicted lipid-binding transport protein (Tim44 family)